MAIINIPRDVYALANLKGLRMLRGMTQSELAHRSGVPVWKINRFERGYLKPTPDELMRIINFLSTGEEGITDAR